MSRAGRRAALVAAGAFVAGAWFAASGARAQDPSSSEAQRAARDWLALTDRGEGTATWNAAGARFRAAITAERWTEAVKSVRDPLGAVGQRSVQSTRFADSIPGAPDGRYAIMVFRTAFAHKAVARETVTLEREPDGRWRVIGYFVE